MCLEFIAEGYALVEEEILKKLAEKSPVAIETTGASLTVFEMLDRLIRKYCL